MKIKCYIGNVEVNLEVYKVQVSLFGKIPSVLIYNEDKSQLYETNDKKEVMRIRKFIGHTTIKCYIAGNQGEDGQIVFQKVIPRAISKDYTW